MVEKTRQWWTFTFGCGQRYENCYVKIYGTYGEARSEMFRKYGEEWAFQYSEAEWRKWENERPPYISEIEIDRWFAQESEE